MNRTTVTLDPGLRKRLKQEAARLGKTFQECLNDYLRLGLEASRFADRGNAAWRLPELSLGCPLVDAADREAVDRLERRP
jgi:hypothetical protein